MTADGHSLGAPSCHSDQNVYLKTVFACVRKDVLKKKYLGIVEEDTVRTTSKPEEEEEEDEAIVITVMEEQTTQSPVEKPPTQQRTTFMDPDDVEIMTTTTTEKVTEIAPSPLSVFPFLFPEKGKLTLFFICFV